MEEVLMHLRFMTREEKEALRLAISERQKARYHRGRLIDVEARPVAIIPEEEKSKPRKRQKARCVDCGDDIYYTSTRCTACAPRLKVTTKEEKNEKARLRAAARLERMTPEEREKERELWRVRKQRKRDNKRHTRALHAARAMEGSSS